MSKTIGNVALATENVTEVTTIATSKSRISCHQQQLQETQINFISKLFLETALCKDDATGMEPLVIKKSNVHLASGGYGDIIEIHGFYFKNVAEEAIFQLQDDKVLPGWSKDAITELIADDTGMISAIRFIKPVMHAVN